jgi:hypothetical protein
MMTTEIGTTSWVMLIALGAFHGINPGMGWLFAVALGMQERRRSAVLRALVPLGAGHALAVAGAIGAALAIGTAVPISDLRWLLAGVLVSLGLMRFFRFFSSQSPDCGCPNLRINRWPEARLLSPHRLRAPSQP